ncbi:MAG: retropepsin-like aspartic protease [Smithella sp.]|jgi:hypothetical protein
MNFKFLTRSLVVLCLLFIPVFIDAGTFYQCVDKDGTETLLDFPVEDQTCTPIGIYEERSDSQRENKAAVPSDNKITKIVVRGNQVLIPATIVYGGKEVDVRLLMDTGATRTVIHTEISDRLYISRYKTKKAKAGVVGGGIIETNIITIDSLKIGPHSIRNWDIMVVPHEGYAVNFDGLLGMDVLGKMSYRIDLAKQVIIWE